MRLAARGKRFIVCGLGFILAAESPERPRLCNFILKAVFIRNCIVRVFGRLFRAELVVQQIVGRFHPRLPFELNAPAKLVAQARLDDFWSVDLYSKLHLYLFPPHSDHGGIWFRVVKIIGKGFLALDGLRLHGHAKRVFGLVKSETPPGSAVLRENDDPRSFAGNHMQPIHTLRKWLPLNVHRVGELDAGVLVGPGAPNLSVSLNASEDLSAADQRAAVVNRDIGDADSLRHTRVLASARQIQHRRLGHGAAGGTQARNNRLYHRTKPSASSTITTSYFSNIGIRTFSNSPFHRSPS